MSTEQPSPGENAPEQEPEAQTAPEPAAGPAADPPAANEPAADPPAANQPAAADQQNEEPATPRRSFVDALVTANSGTVTVLAIVLSLLVGAGIIVVSDPDVLATFSYLFSRPTDALYAIWNAVGGAYAALVKGALLDPEALQSALAGETEWHRVFRPISETLTNAAPLILTGLSFTLAFRSGLINIGGNGQAIMGAVVAGMAGFWLHLPPVVHLLVALLGGLVGGAAWGFVPGILKARTGAHEVIVTIMLNYIALNFLVWLVIQEGVQRPGRNDAISRIVDENAQLWPLAGEFLRVNLGILLALAMAGVVAWLLRRSTLGFQMRTVGSNPDAARTAGMSVGRTYVAAMSLAGALSGLGGATILLGTMHSLTPAIVGQTGFDGITVALLGRAKPLGTVLAGLLFGAMRAGAVRMQGAAGVPVDMVMILQALIVLFIAAPALVKTVFRLRAERGGGLGLATAKGW